MQLSNYVIAPTQGENPLWRVNGTGSALTLSSLSGAVQLSLCIYLVPPPTIHFATTSVPLGLLFNLFSLQLPGLLGTKLVFSLHKRFIRVKILYVSFCPKVRVFLYLTIIKLVDHS